MNQPELATALWIGKCRPDQAQRRCGNPAHWLMVTWSSSDHHNREGEALPSQTTLV